MVSKIAAQKLLIIYTLLQLKINIATWFRTIKTQVLVFLNQVANIDFQLELRFEWWANFRPLYFGLHFELLTLFLQAMGGISPYMNVTWPSPVGIGLSSFLAICIVFLTFFCPLNSLQQWAVKVRVRVFYLRRPQKLKKSSPSTLAESGIFKDF